MEISKLTTRVLIKRIALYEERRVALSRNIEDITEASTKEALNEQLTNYKGLINQLKKELSKRSDLRRDSV